MLEQLDIEHYNFVKKYITNWGTAIDGGANIGNWSRLMAKDFQYVHSFEPIEDICKNIPDNVILHNSALGAHVGKAKFGIDRKKNSSRAAYIVIGEGPINVSTIDSHLYQEKIGLIKLDLEGFEYFALLGSKKIIKKHLPLIVVEIDPLLSKKYNVIGGNAISEYLLSLNYKCIDSINKDFIFKYQISEDINE